MVVLKIFKKYRYGEPYMTSILQDLYLKSFSKWNITIETTSFYLLPVSYTHLDVYKRQVLEIVNYFRVSSL